MSDSLNRTLQSMMPLSESLMNQVVYILLGLQAKHSLAVEMRKTEHIILSVLMLNLS